MTTNTSIVDIFGLGNSLSGGLGATVNLFYLERRFLNPAVTDLFGTREPFRGRQFSMDRGGGMVSR